MLAPDVHIGLRHPTGIQVQILLDAVPFVLIELAGRQRIYTGAGLDGDICDDQTVVVERKVTVDGLGKDTIAIVEEKDQDEGEEE